MFKIRLKDIVFICVIITLSLFLISCNTNNGSHKNDELVYKESVKLLYADQFSIDRYENGYSIIKTADEVKYLIVPENMDIPDDIGEMKVIRQSKDNIYLAATSAMGLFDAIGEVDCIKFSGTTADDWYIESARKAMNDGEMIYAGKYREPDYEMLLSGKCRLAVESSMINHSPEVKDKLEEIGITVFTDLSSYENHPLGRCEWIKVYGEITGKQEEADRLFEEQADYLTSITTSENVGKTAVYFYISDSGQIITRKSGDYITKMIELAGGTNVFADLGSGSSSSVTMEPEKFYETAKDADYIIYNSTIGGEVASLDELISKYELLSEFKAVKNENVWCTKNNLFQETMKLGNVISDLNLIFTDKTTEEQPKFMYKLGNDGSNE